MKIKKGMTLTVFAIIVLVLTLSIAGCAKPAPAPAPAPAAPAQAPTPQPTPHAEVHLEFGTQHKNSKEFITLMALNTMLQEEHPWLRLTASETITSVERVTTADGLPPERRKNALWTDALMGLRATMLGIKPIPKPFPNIRLVMAFPHTYKGQTLPTWDSSINRLEDLRGKKVATFPKGSSIVWLTEFMFRDCNSEDLWNSIDWLYTQPSKFKDAYLSKQVVAYVCGITIMGDKYTYAIKEEELRAAAKTLHWLDITKEEVDKGNRESTFLKLGWQQVPKDGVHPGEPDRPIGTATWATGMVCWDEADEETIYELVKFVDQHNGAPFDKVLPPGWGSYVGGSAMYTIATPWGIEWHPGAMKYYKEVGYAK